MDLIYLFYLMNNSVDKMLGLNDSAFIKTRSGK